MRLQGEVGIGRGIVLAMSKERAHIAIVDVNEEKRKRNLC